MNSGSSLNRHASAPEEQLLLQEMHKNSISIIPSKQNLKYGEKKFVEPVRLTPAWEEKNLPNDVLNFKSVTMEQAELETNPPKDRFLLVYFILMIHGIGTLMPWNMFITAKDYFEYYKLGKKDDDVNMPIYIVNFMQFLGFFSQVPNIAFAWLNIFINFGGNLTSRIVYSIMFEVLVFVFTEIMVLVDTSGYPFLFFCITMASVFLLNVANGIYQNTVYGLAAKLPFIYTGAVILGSNISGIFTAVISIVSKMMSPSPRTAAVYYFIVALFVLFICFDTYFILPLTKFYKFHDLQFQKAEQKALAAAEEANVRVKVPYWKIFKQCFPQCFNAFFVFLVTLAVFPAVHASINRSSDDFFVSKDYYVDIMCFLTFNLFATVGSLLSTFCQFPGPNTLFIPILLRTVFIPLFLFCKYETTHRVMPIYIQNDWIYFGIGVLFAVTSGYFSSLAMMYCGKTVAPEHSSIAGMFGAACLVTGIFSGILVSFVFPPIVANISW